MLQFCTENLVVLYIQLSPALFRCSLFTLILYCFEFIFFSIIIVIIIAAFKVMCVCVKDAYFSLLITTIFCLLSAHLNYYFNLSRGKYLVSRAEIYPILQSVLHTVFFCFATRKLRQSPCTVYTVH